MFCILASTLTMDLAISRDYGFSSELPLLQQGLSAFIVIAISYAINQYLFLYVIRSLVKETRLGKLSFRAIHNGVQISQYVIVMILAITILEMIFLSRYETLLIITVIGVGYATAVFMMTALAFRFFNWFKIRKRLLIFFCGLSAASLATNTAFVMGPLSQLLITSPVVVPRGSRVYNVLLAGSVQSYLNSGYILASIAGFIITWIATVYLFRPFLKTSRRPVYLAVIFLPLIYFVAQFVSPLQSFIIHSQLVSENPTFVLYVYILALSLSKPIGGLLFGLAYWVAAAQIKQQTLKNYIIIAGYGFVLFFLSNQADLLVDGNYPPFGLVSVSTIGLAAYLVFFGIYSSAVQVTQDASVRHLIRKVAVNEMELASSIGSAELIQRLHNQVSSLVRKELELSESETGVHSSLTEQDTKDYLKKVIEEIRSRKEQS